MERVSHTWDIGAPSARCIARWEDDGGSVIDASERRTAMPSHRKRVAIVERGVSRSLSPRWNAPACGHLEATW